MAKLILTFVVAASIALAAVGPAAAQPAEMDMCSHEPTIDALSACLQHAIEVGHVTDAGVAQSLTVKVANAQAALDRGDSGAAVGLLNAFVLQVGAQSGKSIDAMHAEHLIGHATAVIAALRT